MLLTPYPDSEIFFTYEKFRQSGKTENKCMILTDVWRKEVISASIPFLRFSLYHLIGISYHLNTFTQKVVLESICCLLSDSDSTIDGELMVYYHLEQHHCHY